MVRVILKWCDKKFDEVMKNDDNLAIDCVKSFGIGAIEGAIDGFVLLGAVVTITEIIKAVKGTE